MQEKKEAYLTIRVSEKYLADVDRIAKKLKITRSQLVLNILSIGLADAKLLEKIGLVDIAAVMRAFQGDVCLKLKTV